MANTITQPYSSYDILGKKEYEESLSDWRGAYGTYSNLMNEVTPKLSEMTDYYKPGGGYGQGLRQEAKENVQGGVNKDLSQMVATGMSSQAGAKGLQTLAGSELGKMYKNIEDTRNQLWQESITPYAQMMTSLAQFQASRPNYGSSIKTPGTTKYQNFGPQGAY